jgi:hypothetical protein
MAAGDRGLRAGCGLGLRKQESYIYYLADLIDEIASMRGLGGGDANCRSHKQRLTIYT